MKYFILCLFFIGISLCSIGQTSSDSTDIKLEHYKELFTKGLITAQEYEALKQKLLDIQTITPAQQTPHIDSAQLAKLRIDGQTATGIGAFMLGVGGGVMGGVAGGLWRNGTLRRTDMIVMSVFSGLFGTIGLISLPIGISKLSRYGKINSKITFGMVGYNKGGGVSVGFTF